jgi:hypothetical protein
MKTTTANKELINAATVNRVVSKSGQCLGYLVRSNSTDAYYEVTFDNGWHCTCEACKNNRHCCHAKAVSQVCQARKQLQAEAVEAEREAVLQAARLASEAQLKQIEAETLAYIEAECSKQPVSIHSDQWRIAHLPSSTVEHVNKTAKVIDRMTAPLNGNRDSKGFAANSGLPTASKWLPMR